MQPDPERLRLSVLTNDKIGSGSATLIACIDYTHPKISFYKAVNATLTKDWEFHPQPLILKFLLSESTGTML